MTEAKFKQLNLEKNLLKELTANLDLLLAGSLYQWGLAKLKGFFLRSIPRSYTHQIWYDLDYYHCLQSGQLYHAMLCDWVLPITLYPRGEKFIWIMRRQGSNPGRLRSKRALFPLLHGLSAKRLSGHNVSKNVEDELKRTSPFFKTPERTGAERISETNQAAKS